MILSIIAFVINIGMVLLNIIAAKRNRRRADALRTLENDILDYATRLPQIEKEIIDRERERWEHRRFIVSGDMIDPARIADPKIRAEIILRRMFADYCPN